MATNNAVNSPLNGTTGTGQFVGDTSAVLKGNNYAVDVGTVNSYSVVFSPVIASLVDDFKIDVLIDNTNTGASTLTVDSNPAKNILNADGTSLSANALLAGMIATFAYNGTEFQLMNSALSSSSVTAQNIQDQTFVYSGSVSNIGNDYSATFTPVFTSLQAGQKISILSPAANTNNTQSAFATLDVDGLGAVIIAINSQGGIIPAYINALGLSTIHDLEYDGTYWVLLNPANSVVATNLLSQSYLFDPVDMGGFNDYIIDLPYLYVDLSGFPITGSKISFVANNDNSGASTLTISGGPPISIITNNGNLVGGEFISGRTYELVYIGGTWTLLNPSNLVNGAQVQNGVFNSAIDLGVADAYVVTLSPPVFSPGRGLLISFVPDTNNNGASTIDIGYGAILLQKENNVDLIDNDLVIGVTAHCIYNSGAGNVILLNPQSHNSYTIYGTQTNDNAPTGYIGEFISDQLPFGTPVALTSGVVSNIIQIDVGPGDWDIWGAVSFGGNILTLTSVQIGWLSTTSATLPTSDFYNTEIYGASGLAVYAVARACFNVPTIRISVNTITTIYLSAYSEYTVSSADVCGNIRARRVR